ncbi:hypothetical protein AB0G14_35785, partial [Micromonospora sp. NPDC023814]
MEIVRKLADQVGFQVLHRRWVVERSLWINRCRRTVRDYERSPEHHAAMVRWAMVIIHDPTPRPTPQDRLAPSRTQHQLTWLFNALSNAFRATPVGVALNERLSGGVLLSHTLPSAVPSALEGLASG